MPQHGENLIYSRCVDDIDSLLSFLEQIESVVQKNGLQYLSYVRQEPGENDPNAPAPPQALTSLQLADKCRSSMNAMDRAMKLILANAQSARASLKTSIVSTATSTSQASQPSNTSWKEVLKFNFRINQEDLIDTTSDRESLQTKLRRKPRCVLNYWICMYIRFKLKRLDCELNKTACRWTQINLSSSRLLAAVAPLIGALGRSHPMWTLMMNQQSPWCLIVEERWGRQDLSVSWRRLDARRPT